MNSEVSLAILCGGMARRLGSDKGLFRPLGDESLVARALRRFTTFTDDILIVVRDSEQAKLYSDAIADEAPELRGNFRIVADDDAPLPSEFQGSLRGVYTAMSRSRHDKVMALPVDQVAVTTPHLRMLSHTNQTSAFRTTDRALLSFPSQWRKEDSARIAALIAAGSYSVANALEQQNAYLIDGSKFTQALNININTTADAETYFGRPLFDRYDRRMHYLRFSLIESCNMSCHYCLPDGFPEWYRHKARLSKDDIAVLLAGFRRLGFRKVRFTGGEPTLHPGCLNSVRAASDLGYEEICLTTNGSQLGDLREWQDAGLTGLNISLDSVNPDTFNRMTKSRYYDTVMEAVDQACSLGINLKINTVLLRSQNGDEIEELIDWALARPLSLRFIELMPTKLNQSFDNEERVHGYEIEPRLFARGLTEKLGPEQQKGLTTKGPATIYRSQHHKGNVGLINPLSCNFCSSCNRLRLGAKGGVRLCLFAEKDMELPKSDPEAVEAFMRKLIETKEERHHLEDREMGNVSTFRTIGG